MSLIINTPTLETNRLILRKFTQQDIHAIFAIFSDEKVNTFLPWFPLKSLEEAKIFFEERYAQIYKQIFGYRYAICLKTNNIPIGYINISYDDSYDLGYGLMTEFWHNGIVTEACERLVEHLKKTDIPYITATHDIENSKSGNIMRKIGMSYCYSYEEQWQPKDKKVIFRMYQLSLDDRKDRIFKKYWDNSVVRFVEKII